MPTITVEVDSSEFTDEDILEEAESRGILDGKSTDEFHAELKLLFQSGAEDKVVELCRQQINDRFGTCY